MKERISSLIDGHDDSAGSMGDAIASVAGSESAHRMWAEYHLIGDALRREGSLGVDLTSTVMAQLEEEPTVLAPIRAFKEEPSAPMSWQRALPIAASVMGVAAVGWVAMQMNQQETVPMLAASAPQAAVVQPVAVNAAVPVPLSRDTALRAYVMAHQGTAGGAFPGVAPYVRTVAEMPQARR